MKGAYYKSSAANPSSAGILRLGNNESIGWRNAGNSADYLLKVNASNLLQFDSKSVLLSGDVVNADINASAAIAYSKLNLATSIVNADISGSAAIAYSKLNLATSIVNADISGSAAIAYSKLNLSTSIVNADISASAAIAYSKLAATTASRALVSDGSGFVSASSVTSAELGYVSGVTSAIQTQLDAKAPSASPTLTTPSTDIVTLDGQGSTPTSPSSGFYKLYVKDDTNKLTVLDSSGNETSVGAGGGGINLITNGDAESGTTGWATYAYAAGTRPVDGTGGSPNVTWTTSATTPLYGVNSFLLTKDAADRQGQGASFAFTVQPAHQAKVLNISFDYIVSSGTFVAGTSSTDSDIIAYIYDVTNSQLIEPSSIKLLSNSTSIADRFNATFQTSATGTSYRLILHCASTSESAYVVKFDNISVSPSNYSYGTPITDWQSYTPTFTGFGTTSAVDFRYRRVGSDLEIRGQFTSGTSTAVEAQITLPSGLTSSSSIATIEYGGGCSYSQTGANVFNTLIEPSKTYFTMGLQAASYAGSTKQNGNALLSSGQSVKCTVKVPISGWSSSVQMSDQQDTRVCSMLAYKNAGSATANTDISSWTAVSKDSHGAFNTSTGVYTVPVAGDYYVDFNWEATVSGTVSSSILVNNTIVMTAAEGNDSNADYGVSMLLTDLKVGDLITVQSNTTKTLSSSNVKNKLAIFRLSGPNQLAAIETISASYYCSTNQSATSSAPFNFDTKEYDSHGAVTTGASWKFTAPAAGLYEVSGYIEKVTATTSGFDIYKNGSSYKRASASLSSGVTYSNFYASIRLIARDYIELRPSASITIYGGSLTSASHITIKRIGM